MMTKRAVSRGYSLIEAIGAQITVTLNNQLITTYQQYAQGYPIAGYGYFIASQNGIFRSANGKVTPRLPPFAAVPYRVPLLSAPINAA